MGRKLEGSQTWVTLEAKEKVDRENARLRDELADCKAERGALMDSRHESFSRAVSTLRARVAELEKDEKRLDWLSAFDPEQVNFEDRAHNWQLGGYADDDLRSAIDAAMADEHGVEVE